MPACITTGYMCKSAGRGCFSDLVDHVDVYRARHGCLDLLDDDRQRQCKNQPRPSAAEEVDDDVPAWEQEGLQDQDDAQPQIEQHQQQEEDTIVVDDAQQDVPRDTPSLLLCCTEDMCNHIDSPDSRMRHSGPNGSEAAHVTVSSPAGAPAAHAGQAGPSAGTSEAAAAAAAAARSAEMWFKAATIAVPICGALILVLLIVLAVRLLRADSQHQRASKLSACAFPALSDKKVPLLPCGTGVGWGHGPGHGHGVNRLGPSCGGPGGALAKNHALAKLNYSASYDLLDLHKDDNCSQQRNVLLAPSTPKSSYKEVLASFVPWGGSCGAPADPPASV
ncbi:hypothetical protein FOCC_FOCC008777 [Frankliniella occidentalis]|nr:hypothetical protein FOCC_FOCC008777 [Frankliniella occidentalis]